ncbi:MAG TPA: hypothetical protein VER96_12470 [Polyangiaceae bacterium]|nr:hypothetical protein [Polyangiaceae bacterium]
MTTQDPFPKTAESSVSLAPAEHVDQAVSALKASVTADAHDLSDEAKHVAGDVMAHARKSAGAQITGGKDRVAEGLGSIAHAIRQTGEQLRAGDEAGLTEYAVRAADGVEAASDYLKEKSLSEVLGDVAGFARREPAMFLGGAFVLGVLGGRFLKSSHMQPALSNNGSRNNRSAAPSFEGGQRTVGRDAQRNSRAKPSQHANGGAKTPGAV